MLVIQVLIVIVVSNLKMQAVFRTAFFVIEVREKKHAYSFLEFFGGVCYNYLNISNEKETLNVTF